MGPMPKKPLTGYMCFYQQLQAEAKKNLPGAAAPEIARMIAQRWNQLTDALK
jgi:hypothetical protein